MTAASTSRGVFWLCALRLLTGALEAQCTSPTQVPNQTISSGNVLYADNNALSANAVVINGSASVRFVAGHCIQLLPSFNANAKTASAATTFHAWVETAPANVSVWPSAGSGMSQQFTFTFSSPAGYSNLSEVFGLIGASTVGSYSCYIRYNRSSNLLYLAGNSGSDTWLGGFVPGSSGTASNYSCTINGSGSTASGSGTQLAVTVAVTFSAYFGQYQNIYLLGYNNDGLNSTWQQMGTWNVFTSQQYSLTTAVNGPGSISPGSGSYNSGVGIAITATPNAGYRFTGFSGDLTGSTNPQTLVMNGNKSVTANFAAMPPSLTISTTSLPNGTQGVTYLQGLAAAGGTPPYTWSLTGGSLPAGLTLNNTGFVTGTPSLTGTSSFTVKVTDSSTAPQTASASLTLTIVPPPLSITTATLSPGQAGSAYSASLQAIGGTPGYSWSIATGSLPAGLSLATNGQISGTPTATGTSSFTAKVTDQAGATATSDLSISISNAVLVSISITAPSSSIAVGATDPFTATGTYSDASTANITGQVTWTSSNTSVATIAPGGLAQAVAQGTTNITAGLGSINSNVFALTVTGASVREYIRLNGRVIAIENHD